MKKEEKIIKIRTAAKVELARINAKYAQEEADEARRKSEELTERVGCCANERFNVIEKYKAIFAAIKADRLKDVAKLYENTEKLCDEATDDPEREQEPKTETEQPQQTVYCDGSEHSARIAARRLINKLPHIPAGGSINVNVVRDTYADRPEYFVSVSYGDKLRRENEIFAPGRHTAEFEAAFMEKVRSLFEAEPESGNSHVADPMAHALDAVFGGNPVEQVENLISDTVKSGKEGENE